jgi:cobalt-zinc-cadmium efflux system membrane fusion protein
MTRAARWILLACLGAAIGCADPPDAPRDPDRPPNAAWLTAQQIAAAGIEVQPVAVQQIEDTIRTSGKVVFDDSHVSHVFSPVSGRITEIRAQLGQHVRRGDVLAVIESPDIGAASSDLGKAEADLAAAEHEYKRQNALFAAHAASERDREQAQDGYLKAKAELERARQKARLLNAPGVNVVTQSYTLLAEIEGEVVARGASPGMEVQGQYSVGTSPELFTIGDLDNVWVLADLYEMDLAHVKIGVPVSVTTVAEPGRVFTGQVDWVSESLDPTTRTAKVRSRFDNADHSLRPEMFVTVKMTVDVKRALAIPRSALLRLGDHDFVFVRRGTAPAGRTQFERVKVEVEDEGEGDPWLSVTSGLAAGDEVVTSGAILLAGTA